MSNTYVPSWLRERVAAQANQRCGYCQNSETITGIPLVIDHLVPEVLGGLTVEENLWMACNQCNLHKGDRLTVRDPTTNELVLLFNPRRQVWSEHFQWADNGEQVVGLTAIGHVTVQALRLNRGILVSARRRWVRVGWHPPHE